MTYSELVILRSGVNITTYTIQAISEIGTVVQMFGYDAFAI